MPSDRSGPPAKGLSSRHVQAGTDSPQESPQTVEQRRDLRRMKLVAFGLLVAAAVVFVVAKINEDAAPWVPYVRATAEAAMVGALADWFAVTALFRHPLGLPIPHTAIIPRRKDEIGRTMGTFVRDNFLTHDVITQRLRQAQLGRRAGEWLAQPDNAAQVGDQSAVALKGVTEVLQDDVVSDGIEELVVRRVRSVPITPLVGRAVDVAVDGEHHQVLLESTLFGVSRFLGENQATFRRRLSEESPWWVPDAVDDVVFDKIYDAVSRFIDDVAADRNHELRGQLDERAARLATELKESEELALRGEELRDEMLAHPEVRAWVASLWDRIKVAMLEAMSDPESPVRIQLSDALVNAGQHIEQDPELQAKIDDWIINATGYVADQFRSEVADLIASVVESWDADETSDRMELQVGRDLQFIRINGTIVGGLAGLVIHAVGELLV